MEAIQTEDRTKLRGQKAKEAIALALQGRWEEAVQANREILRLFPEDVEALNRLGKAFLELGNYDQAKEAFQRTFNVSPHNIIAKKNLERLARLRGYRRHKATKKAMPYHFIAESGRSGVTVLTGTAPREILSRVVPGEVVQLQMQEHGLTVRTLQGEYLGQIEPKLAFRLSRLMKGGNRYEGAVVSTRPDEVAVLLMEVYRDPSQANVVSFPISDADYYRPYSRGALLQYTLEDSEEEGRDEEGTVLEWSEEANSPFEFDESVVELEPI